jgi:hypothetical protein
MGNRGDQIGDPKASRNLQVGDIETQTSEEGGILASANRRTEHDDRPYTGRERLGFLPME